MAVGVGPAGTGKTFALDAARTAWELDGYRVLGAAPTGTAAVRLEQGSAIEGCRTIDRLLMQLERGEEELDHQTVLVVDLCRLWNYADMAGGGDGKGAGEVGFSPG